MYVIWVTMSIFGKSQFMQGCLPQVENNDVLSNLQSSLSNLGQKLMRQILISQNKE